ncbi:MAG TPA: AAA family ATPase [Syntrophorhabdaceae bacterium]|nr:AAA family ATPase [Syntrophorhabdaceae bacterium]
MHVKSVTLHPDMYPTRDHYPFNLSVFGQPERIVFSTPITLFVGENGTGKSTLLQALARKCGVHIWQDEERRRAEFNPDEDRFCDYISIEWADSPIQGSFFGSSLFQDFVRILDDWAAASPGLLEYFGGESLMTKSHGQSIMSFFKARYRIKGIYLLDEPETALSPKTQLELLNLLVKMGADGHAQFIIATHSPILLACPNASILSFDDAPIREVSYEQTEHYKIYKDFMGDRKKYLDDVQS